MTNHDHLMWNEFLGGVENHLPSEVLNDLKLKHPGEKLEAYAHVDMSNDFHMSESWVVLTSNLLIYKADEKWLEIPRSQIHSTQEINGLSSNDLFFRAPNTNILLHVRYSHRCAKPIGVIIQKLAQKDQAFASSQIERVHEVYREQALGPVIEAQSSIYSNKAAVIWRLLTYLRPYRLSVIFGLSSAVGLTVLSLIPPFLTGRVIDQVIKPLQDGSISEEFALHQAWILIGILSLVYILREVFGWIRLRTMSMLGELVAKDLRDEVYSHLHTLSLKFFSSKQTGSIISRVGSDTDRIWDFIAFGVVEVTMSLIMLVGLSAVLIYLDWPLGLLVTAPVPFILYAIFRHGERMQGLFLRAWRKWSDLTDCVSDTIPGIKVVKAFHKHQEETERFKISNRSVVKEFLSIHKAWTGFWPLLMITIHFMVVAVWFFGVPRVIASVSGAESDLTPGVFVSFVLYLTMFTQPIEVIGQMARMINRATSSAHRVFEIIDTRPQLLEVNEPVKLNSLKGEIEFKNVSFSYDGIRPVLKNISFSIKEGEMIGLVGSSGGGKSTIISLIPRFYDVTRGEVLIDGVNVKQLDLESFRNQVGMVLQDPYLFHGSILENIRYARPDASLLEVVEAAKKARAHDFILKLPHGYDTYVGERGHTLSGGERQRVSIARAILRNPRILILDEATSAVDSETEFEIQTALDHLIQGRTVIAIAHRLSTLASADRLFVIKDGEIVESGTHNELLSQEQGVYKNLIQMQNRAFPAAL